MEQKKFEETGGLTYFYMDEIQPKSWDFSSKAFSAKPQFETWECSTCYRSILNNLSQRGMERTKCDDCRKETDRLINTIRYWESKVGVKILETV